MKNHSKQSRPMNVADSKKAVSEGNPSKKPLKLTDAERHARFVGMVQEIGASTGLDDFDKAFTLIASHRK